MSYRTHYKTFTAGAAIAARRIVKFGADDTHMIQGAAVADLLVGVSAELDVASGQRFDAAIEGMTDVEAGAAITRGALVTSDATGRAIALAPASGQQGRSVGQAMASATAAGDIIPILITKAVVTTP